MQSITRETQPLAPLVPFGGLALRPVPLALLQPVLAAALVAMRRQHPDVFVRLEPLGDADILIDPTDLTFRFRLRLGAGGPSLAALRRDGGPLPARAAIRGPLAMLIALLEGRIDGDAVFFSRGLTVEGDMEAVVALRNAVDSAEIDLAEDLAAALGPFAGPARRLMPLARAVAIRAAEDLDAARDVLFAPLAARCARQAARLDALEREVAALRSELARAERPRRAAARRDSPR